MSKSGHAWKRVLEACLVAGQRWQYRQFTPLVGPAETEVTMSAGTAGRFSERTAGDPGDDAELSRCADGQTLISLLLPLSPGRTNSISGVELPRELRAGQQFTVFDARVEGIDVALWRVVVGFEEIRIPASPTPVRALRIDDRGAVRNSAAGSPPAEQVYGSTWYLPDVGVVRSVEWTDAARSVTASDERLLGFEGVNRGFGVVKRPTVVQAPGAAVLADGYVGFGADFGQTLVADRNGRQLATGSWVRPPEIGLDARLVPTSAGVRVVKSSANGAGDSFALDALDATGLLAGERLARLPFRTDDAFLAATFNAVRFAGHHASPVLWMLYVERIRTPDSSFQVFLVAQRFDPAGQPVGSLQRWEVADEGTGALLQVEATPDRLVVLLRQGDVQFPGRVRWMEISNAGSVLRDRSYRINDFSVVSARVVVDGDARWLAWTGNDGQPRAWRLGEDGAPMGVAETLDAALAAIVPLPNAVTSDWPRNLVAAGGRWTISGADFAPLNGEPATGSNQARPHAVLALFDPGEGDIRNRPQPGLIRVDASSLGTSVRFADRTLWDGGFVQWR